MKDMKIFALLLALVQTGSMVAQSREIPPLQVVAKDSLRDGISAPPPAKIRLMMLGNSITASTCYQPFLWEHILKDSLDRKVEFVGTKISNNGLGVTCGGKQYFLLTEGHPSWTSGNIADSVGRWAAYDHPDVVVMHVGTNNFWNGTSPALIKATLKDYGRIVDSVRKDNPAAKILVAQIIPMNYTAASLAGSMMLDDSIPSWAASRNTASSPVAVVDLRTGWDLAHWYSDGTVHPNELGSHFMADRVYAALTALGWLGGVTSRTLSFSGYQWTVKYSPVLANPGPNYFLDDSTNVRVDSAGRLHMKITKRNAKWQCSEVVLGQSLGYGRYVVQVIGDIGGLNENVAFNLFTWEDNPAVNNREIDLEFSRLGNAADTMNSEFALQPDTLSAHRFRWRLPVVQDTLTNSFNWQKDSVSFLSVRGQSDFPPYGLVNASWKYTGTGIPTPGFEKTHINAWLYQGHAPTDSQEVEIIIVKFEFNPLPPPPAPVLEYPQKGLDGITTNPTVQWDTAAFAQSYRLQVSRDSLFGTTLVDDSSLTLNWKGLHGLNPLQTYYWRVKAKNQIGPSAWSEVWWFKTGTGITETYFFTKHWNLVSLPLQVSNPTVSALFPFSLSKAFEYTAGGAYRTRDTLEMGKGYWVKFSDPQTLSITGQPITLDTLTVFQGWNLIGSLTQPFAVRSIRSVPPGMVTTNVFGYQGTYFITDSILPGNAYWVKVSKAGSLIVASAMRAEPSDRIRIMPTAELPPRPPFEMRGVEDFPTEFKLDQAYPNPFNPATTIRYQLPIRAYVTLRVYDILGRDVATLLEALEEPGYKSVTWDASRLSSGMYYYRLEAGTFIDTKKLLLLK